MTHRPACDVITAVWDAAVTDVLDGGSAVPAVMKGWSQAYRGRGRGAVNLDAFPEPYLRH